jgi:hypothetical protein
MNVLKISLVLVIFYFCFLIQKKILFISLILSHLNHLLILIPHALLYNEVKHTNQFCKANLIQITFFVICINETSYKTTFDWSKIIFKTLINLLMLSTKTLNQSDIWWKFNFNKTIVDCLSKPFQTNNSRFIIQIISFIKIIFIIFQIKLSL